MFNLKIVTFNIRCEWEGNEYNGDGINGFVSRIGMIYDKISQDKPDIIAFQEVMPRMLDMLERMFPEYIFAGQGREADFSGEGLYTAIKRESLRLIGMENFWIAPDPYNPKSRFSDQGQPRICNSVTLLHKTTGKLIRIFNVHLCNAGNIARTEGIKSVLNRAKTLNNNIEAETVIIGDFNIEPDSETYKACENFEAIHLTDLTKNLPESFHNYGRGSFYYGRNIKIDFIFVSDYLKSCFKNVYFWDEEQNGIYLSDHYPVCAEFEI